MLAGEVLAGFPARLSEDVDLLFLAKAADNLILEGKFQHPVDHHRPLITQVAAAICVVVKVLGKFQLSSVFHKNIVAHMTVGSSSFPHSFFSAISHFYSQGPGKESLTQYIIDFAGRQ